MKSFIILIVLLVSPVLWAKSWYYSCGKTMGIESKILIDEAPGGSWMLLKAQYTFAGRDGTTQTIKAMTVDLIGSLAEIDVMTGKREKTFAFQKPEAASYQLYVQPTTEVGTQVRAMQLTILSMHPQKITKTKFSCVLANYKN